MRLTTGDGVPLQVTRYGPADAPLTVVLAHCWTLSQEGWHYQVRALQQEFGHRVSLLVWDHRGHGSSGHVRRRQCTVSALAADMGEVVDAFAPAGPLILAGHSIGGMAMMELAEQRPDIVGRTEAVAFVNTSAGELDKVTLGMPETGPLVRSQIPRVLALRSLTLSRRARRRAPILERLLMVHLVFGMPIRLADLGLAVDALIACPAATWVGFYEDLMRHDRLASLKAYAGLPAVVLAGGHDRLTPPAHARRIAAALGIEVTLAPGAGHMLPLERDELVSGALIRLVRPVLARLERGGPAAPPGQDAG